MKNCVNIIGNDQIFTYVIEYSKGNTFTDSEDINWTKCQKDKNCIHLFEGDVKYFRHKNDWYKSDSLELNHQYIPEDNINTSKIRVYLPNHSVSTYKRGVKYSVNANTWINGYKIDLGSFIFKPTDTIASNSGIIKYGNNEYIEYIEFDIIDPFYLTYSDKWIDFRHNVCEEPLNINGTGSLLNISLYVIDEYEDKYLMNSEYSGGITSFNISDDTDYLKLDLSESLDPLGLSLKLHMNSEYNWLLNYLYETYGIDTNHRSIKFEIVIKNKDGIIVGPQIGFDANMDYGYAIQNINIPSLYSNYNIKLFFSSWDNFEEGWNFAASLIVYTEDNHDEEVFTIISNELPITQELFSRFIHGSEKIIDLKDMNISNYNIVNKIENKIIQLERPNDSKSNIIQPVFFRVKETEVLTLHPAVTENICINLDDYKSKVNKFILQIDNCRFDQIGSNNYGVLFKIIGNKLSKDVASGIYYILNEDLELITTGKYNCIR